MDQPEHTAFEVELLDAKWSLKGGRTVDLRMIEAPDHERPHPMKQHTRRRGNRAGTRFNASVTTISEDPQPIYTGELMLAGWGDGSDRGQWATFWIEEHDDMHPFAGLRGRQGKEPGEMLMMVLVELDEDQEEIDQQARGRVERSGQRLSQYAHLLATSSPMFLQFLRERVRRPGQDDVVWTADLARKYIKWKCGVESLSELDRDAAAAARFTDLVRKPFAKWSGVE